MCALRREVAFDFSDLRFLRVVCASKTCQTVVIIDLDAQDTVTLKLCPGCNTAFGDNFRNAVQAFKEAYRGFASTENVAKVGFSIPFDAKVT